MSSTKRKMERDKPGGLLIEHRNAYVCKTCRHVTLVVHIHDGSAPFLIPCESCNEPAQSFMYVLPPVLSLPEGFKGVVPTKEFYTPIGDLMAMALLSPEDLEHVLRGGVILRDRTDAKPITRRIKT